MGIATYSNPAQATNVYHKKELLKHAGPIACLDKYAIGPACFSSSFL